MGFSESLEIFLTWISTVFELDIGEVLIVSSSSVSGSCQLTA